VPARIKGWICVCGTKLNLTADSDRDEQAICKKCSREYVKTGLKVKEKNGGKHAIY